MFPANVLRIDQQRESYDNEHGRHDPGTGTFEFGNDAQRDYSATLEEIAEGIRGLHPNTAPPAPVVPDEKPMPTASNMFAIDAVAAIAEARGWNACRSAMLQGSQPVSNRDELSSPVIPDGYALVPIEPTPEMLRAGFLAGEDYPGGVYRDMIAAAPQQEAE